VLIGGGVIGLELEDLPEVRPRDRQSSSPISFLAWDRPRSREGRENVHEKAGGELLLQSKATKPRQRAMVRP